MNITKTGAAAGAVAVIAAGTFVLTSATASQAAPPHKNSTLTLVDANGVPVPDVVTVKDNGDFVRFIEGALFNYRNTGEFSTAGDGLVAYKDSSCTQPVLVNGDVWDDSSMPLWEPPLAMSASVRDMQAQGAPITAVYVPVGEPQSATLWANSHANHPGTAPSCDPLIGINQNGDWVPTPHYDAKQIPVPADVAGPISFK
jgi:hypothetical protein